MWLLSKENETKTEKIMPLINDGKMKIKRAKKSLNYFTLILPAGNLIYQCIFFSSNSKKKGKKETKREGSFTRERDNMGENGNSKEKESWKMCKIRRERERETALRSLRWRVEAVVRRLGRLWLTCWRGEREMFLSLFSTRLPSFKEEICCLPHFRVNYNLSPCT